MEVAEGKRHRDIQLYAKYQEGVACPQLHLQGINQEPPMGPIKDQPESYLCFPRPEARGTP